MTLGGGTKTVLPTAPKTITEPLNDEIRNVLFMILCVLGSSKCSLPTSLDADRTQVFVYSEDAEGHSVSLMSLKQTGQLVRSITSLNL